MLRRLGFLLTLLLGCADHSSECSDPDPQCSADGYQLLRCENKKSVTVECMRDLGQLCDPAQKACVDPWSYGAPSIPSCPSDPHAVPGTLADKAARYDAIAARLHIHPQLKWASDVVLKPGVAEDSAGVADVASWESGENDGLWSSLYLGSQAFRYAVTRSDQALATIKLLLEGEVTRMKITGVPGLFTRQFIPPNVAGIACPTSTRSYVPSSDKKDNQWVSIHQDGCVWTYDPAQPGWKASTHCGLDAYAGWCWLDNVSKDEYSGHMFALGALVKLVPDPEVQATAIDLLNQVGQHLLTNKLRLIDWDGRVTEHGHFAPYQFDDFPGFNAIMALDFMTMAAVATQRADFQTLIDDCMLEKSGKMDCFDTGLTELEPFPSFFGSSGMYVGSEGCQSNYNNVSMHLLSLHDLLWYTHRDVRLREAIQQSFDADVMRTPDQPRQVIKQHNAFADFAWAAWKRLGPGSDGPALDAINDGICMLRQFRSSNADAAVSLPAMWQPYCKNRFGGDTSQFPRESYLRCSGNFVWWGDPYALGGCQADDRRVAQPAGYLLPYWMGRYYRFIGEAM